MSLKEIKSWLSVPKRARHQGSLTVGRNINSTSTSDRVKSLLEVGENTSTIVLRVVRGDRMGPQCLGDISGPSSSWEIKILEPRPPGWESFMWDCKAWLWVLCD
jgi:hypothetical protein